MNTVLLLALIGTVVLVLSSALILSIRTYQKSLVRSAATNSSRTVAQVSNTVNDYLAGIDGDMETLKETLEDPDVERKEFFDVFLKIRPDVAAVSTYDSTGELVNCYSLLGEVRPNLETNTSFDPGMMDKYADGYVSAPHVVSLFEGAYPWVVTMIAPLEAGSEESWIALDINCSNISAYINDVGIGQRGYCFLMDEDGNIVYHPQQQLIYSDLKSENIDLIETLGDGDHIEGSVIYTIQSVPDSRWQVVGVSYVQEMITDSVSELGRILLFAALVILVAMLIISSILSHALSRPVQSLAEAMTQFEENAEDFTYTPVGGVREVRTLSESFSHMVIRLQSLMGTVKDEQVNLRKTELRALQAQINPHFLYNTLDSISWMTERGKKDEVVEMVNALARLFRISISKGHELIPIRSEIQHAESYLQIQSHRYKNQFTYSFNVDEDCLDHLCNKITLQPIIENAIYHGINGLVDGGEIVVSVKGEGDDIIMTVEDNGNGMNEDQIAAIMNKERSDHTGIGIKNVNDRLKIYFGADYGIRIESVPDEGTKVIIRMPKVDRGSDYEK
ncbi:MAG: sensor histidine kinase [Clostridiales bacterium]|nr:sensor histidine kinase [Clostridiales bacterium]